MNAPSPLLTPAVANGIVSALRVGDCVVVRPEYLTEIRKVAKMMRRTISVKLFHRGRRELYWVKRIDPLNGFPTETRWRLVRE